MRRALILVWALFSASPAVSDTDVYYLAEALYFESRSESDRCQMAVAEVIMERISQDRFKTNTIEEVVHARKRVYGVWRCQFSYYCDGNSDKWLDLDNEQAVRAYTNANYFLYSNEYIPITDGADHYFAHDLVNPYWEEDLYDVMVCEGHTFGKLDW